MARISPDHLDQITKFTHSNRLRARVVLNRFWWDRFGRTYRNSADLLVLDALQAEDLLARLNREWESDPALANG